MTCSRISRWIALFGLMLCMLTTVNAAPPQADQEEGFERLLESGLEGWTGAVPSYRWVDGVLSSTPDGKGNLYSPEEYEDFTLRFEFQLTPGANNGIGVRVPLGGHAAYEGMEIQLLDDTAAQYAKLAPYQFHGSVYGLIPAKRGALRPLGEWNEQEIRLIGRRITVTVNGQVTVDGDLDEALANGPLDGKEHPGAVRESGHLAFLGHKTEVRFRNLRIRRESASAIGEN